MRLTYAAIILFGLATVACNSLLVDEVPTTKEARTMTLHDVEFTALDGTETSFSAYEGKVLLVVNTASECGFTPQYGGLEELQQAYGERGLQVIGFPSNDFGGQEPLEGAAIAGFCSTNYGVTFPLAAKVRVKEGEGQSPVYAYLSGATGKLPGWNFCKYLVGRDGVPIAFYPSTTAPDDAELRTAIEAALDS